MVILAGVVPALYVNVLVLPRRRRDAPLQMQLTRRRRLNSVLISTLNSVLWGIMNSEGARDGKLVVYLPRFSRDVEELISLFIVLLALRSRLRENCNLGSFA